MAKGIRRESNFDLLKIFSIIMVLILHFFNGYYGGALSNVSPGTFNYYATYFLESMSIIAVNCFILVTGYFMIDKKSVDLRKPINLLIITCFYGLIFYLLINGIEQRPFILKDFIKAIIPFYGAKWFVISYIILYCISPFLNLMIKSLTKNNFRKLLILLIFCFSIIPTFFPLVSYNDRGYGFLTFFLLYFIGAYLKAYPVKIINNTFLNISFYLCLTIITFILSLVFGKSSFAWNYNTLFNIFSSVCFFLLFSKLTFSSKTVSFISTFTFPIYIIHTDDTLSPFIFRKILKTNLFWESHFFMINLVYSVILIFFGCILIDFFRRIIVKMVRNKINVKVFGNTYFGL